MSVSLLLSPNLPLLPHHYFLTLYFPCHSLPVSHSLPLHCLTVGEDGGEAERRSVGIITVWRTRMDLYAISVVGCCANLPSTNGTAVHCRSTSSQKRLTNKTIPLATRVRQLSLNVAPSEQSIHAINKRVSRQIKDQ